MTASKSKYECVQSIDRLEHWIKRCFEVGTIAVDLETDSLDSAAANMVGVCLAVADNEACYIPLAHIGGGDMFGDDKPEQIEMDAALALLKPMLEDESILKIGQNFKYDLGVFQRYDIQAAPYDDTMLLSYSLAGGLHGHGMDYLAESHFGHKPISFKEIAGTGKKQKTFDQISLEEATPYAAEDADVTLRLWKFLKPKLVAEQVTTVYEILERPLPSVIAKMENQGIKVDRAELARLSGMFSQKMAGLEAEAYELAGTQFNLGSPKQLGEILFDQMGLEGGKKTKTGAWQTGAGVLEGLAEKGEKLPQTILDWRGYSKLKSTYTDALVQQINPRTGRVHTSFSLAATTTGRLSSSDPNLQNIPIRTEEGRKIRDAFIAETGAAKSEAHEYGYVKTLFGRKCHIKGIKDRNQAVRGFAERQAINAPIQGAAADIMRRAMIRMPEAIASVEGARMLLQVHDELVFEVPKNNADDLIKVVIPTMENAAMPAVNISVPLVVEALAANNWNDAH